MWLVIRRFYSLGGWAALTHPVRAAMSGHSNCCPHGFPQTFSSAHKSNGQCVFSSPARVDTFTPSARRLPSAAPMSASTQNGNKHIPSRLIWCQQQRHRERETASTKGDIEGYLLISGGRANQSFLQSSSGRNKVAAFNYKHLKVKSSEENRETGDHGAVNDVYEIWDFLLEVFFFLDDLSVC